MLLLNIQTQTERQIKMGWNITEGEKAVKVDVDGRLVAAVAPSLREEVLGVMKDGTNVLFDLSGMVQILQKAKAGGGKVVLAALQPGPKIVFDITKVSRVFEIVPTVEDAKF